MIFLFPLPVPCLRECEINYLLHIRRIFDAYARLCEIVPYNPYSGHSLSRAHCIAIQHIQQVWPYNIQLIHHTAHVAAPLFIPPRCCCVHCLAAALGLRENNPRTDGLREDNPRTPRRQSSDSEKTTLGLREDNPRTPKRQPADSEKTTLGLRENNPRTDGLREDTTLGLREENPRTPSRWGVALRKKTLGVRARSATQKPRTPSAHSECVSCRRCVSCPRAPSYK